MLSSYQARKLIIQNIANVNNKVVKISFPHTATIFIQKQILGDMIQMLDFILLYEQTLSFFNIFYCLFVIPFETILILTLDLID